MQPGKPEPELLPPPPPSLVERLVRGMRSRGTPAHDRSESLSPVAARPSVAWAVAALIAAGPLLTLAGAQLMIAREEAAAAELRAAAAPRLAAQRAADEARAMLARTIERPTLGATLEAVATALPEDAQLIRAERFRDGLLELDVAASDPDRLRAALRRSRGLARMRDTGQRASDGAMITSLREMAP